VKIILLFLDGVGIGTTNPEVNPFFRARLPVLTDLLDGTIPHLRRRSIRTHRANLVPVNATLGVAGLPQSGTGQTAIFTGVNAPRKLGRHFGPFPHSQLLPIIDRENILRKILAMKKRSVFANTFPRQFFEYTNSGTRRLTVTTLATTMTGLPLLTDEHLKRNEGVSADLTRERWPDLGYPDVQPIRAAEAGTHLARLTDSHDFVLFEYWLPDHAGHSREMQFSTSVLEQFDEFLGGIVSSVDLGEVLIVLISDHGNIEDLSTKTHTRNPVPCITVGNRAEHVANRIKNLTHLTPVLLEALNSSS